MIRTPRAAWALLASVLIAMAQPASAETLVIGTVAKDVKEELKEFEPLAIFLEARLGSVGIDKVEVAVLPSADRVAEAVREGRVHLYIESPVVAAKVGREARIVPMLRRWKKGWGDYWSEIVVRSDSGLRTLTDLRGRVLAFEDPDSTSGHLLPRALLLENGLAVENLRRPTDRPAPTAVGAVFTSGDKTSIHWLLAGRVDAIATDPGYVQRVEAERPGAIRSIARSISVPRHVVARAADMPEERAARIAAVLVGMADEEAGRRALAAFGKTDRFDAFPNGVEATFAPIEERLHLLERQDRVAGTPQRPN